MVRMIAGDPDVIHIVDTLRHSKPEVKQSIIDRFELGAYTIFSATHILKWHEMPGLNPEEVKRKLESMDIHDSFVLHNEQDGVGVTYVEGWVDEDDRTNPQLIAPNWLDKNFLVMARIVPEEICSLHINLEIANISIWEQFDDLYDPTIFADPPYRVWESVRDMGTYGCYIEAEQGDYEVSQEEELLNNFMPRPKEVYRLKPEKAKNHRLLSTWTVGTLDPNGLLHMHCEYDVTGTPYE